MFITSGYLDQTLPYRVPSAHLHESEHELHCCCLLTAVGLPTKLEMRTFCFYILHFLCGGIAFCRCECFIAHASHYRTMLRLFLLTAARTMTSP
jgi:hypothetical protein